MLVTRIENWLQHAKKYFFTYKAGFYEVSYMANSPDVLVKSVMKMPFVKHAAKNQVVYTNNSFVKAEMHYQELEEGLWVIYANAQYKQNLSYKPIYDKFIPCNYFVLSYSINTNKLQNKAAILNNIEYDNKSWSFIKP